MLSEKEMIAIAVKALDDKKGKDIKVLRTADQTTLADYFIICSGGSNTQVRALAKTDEEARNRTGEEPHPSDGHRGGQRTLIEYSSVEVHDSAEEDWRFYGRELLR